MTTCEIRSWRRLPLSPPPDDPTAPSKASLLDGLSQEQLEWLAFDTLNGGPPTPQKPNSPWWTSAREAQLPPINRQWSVWCILGGRGFGKTRPGAEWIRYRVESGIARRIALVAKDPGEAREVMVEGVSGIFACSRPNFRPLYEPSKKRLTWPNGAIATTFSSEEFEELRGPAHDTAWCDELGKWRLQKETWEQLRFGMRLGNNPQVCVTTTPRPTPTLKAILASTLTVVTGGSTYENMANLSPMYHEIVKEYEGTRLGRQELQAEMLEDVPGALWTYAMLDRCRIPAMPPGVEILRMAVGVDPSASEDGAEAGIVAACKGSDGHAYVMRDATIRARPEAWAKRAVETLEHFMGDRIIAEKNNGGLMVEAVIKAFRRTVPVRLVHASRGKIARAEPISLLYERGLVHHVGTFPDLEDQMCQYDQANAKESPDRMDALVWVLTDLMGRSVVNLSDYSGAGSAPVAEEMRSMRGSDREREVQTAFGGLASATRFLE